MPLVQRDDVIDAFASQRADDLFDDRGFRQISGLDAVA